ALYGHEAARTGKELLKRRGAAGDCRVRLVFELGGEQYEVMRELAGKAQQHQAALKIGGKVAVQPGANSAREVTEAVTRALRMDRDAFFTSLVARQRELQALADLTPGRRKEVVMGMLRIDSVDEAIRLARDERRQVQSALAGLTGLQVDPVLLAQQDAELRAALAGTERALAEARRTLEGTEASLQAVGQARARAEEARRQHDAIAQERAITLAQSEHAQRLLAQRGRELAALGPMEHELLALRPGLVEAERVRAAVEALGAQRERHREAQRLRAELAELTRDAEQAAKRLEQAQADVAQAAVVRAEADRHRATRQKQEALLAEQRAHGKALEDAARDAKQLAAQASARRAELEQLGPSLPCPTCERALGEALPKLLARLDAELLDQAARLAALSAQRSDLEQRLALGAQELQVLQAREDALRKRAEHLWKREAEAEGLRKQRAVLAQRAAQRQATLAQMGDVAFDEAAHTALKARLQALTKSHERALQLQAQLDRRPALEHELSTARAEAERCTALAVQLEARRAQLGFDPAARQQLEERWSALQDRARGEAVEAERHAQRIAQAGQQLDQLALRRAEQERLAAKAGELRSQLQLLERLAGDRDAGLLADFRAQLMARIRPALAERAGGLFRLITDGRYEGLDLTEDYELLVQEEGQRFPLSRFSGGESDAANLCLRIAIGELLAERSGEQLGFLALDEVLASQDDIRRQNVLRALAHLRGRFRQILLVTHLGDVQDSLEHVLHVQDLPDGTSRLELREAGPLAA
ncbi:MAG: SMC family ATPase, partial [Halobacteriales archaeon]|nr:SMC family ATPase [Halobacteriales archaeon]